MHLWSNHVLLQEGRILHTDSQLKTSTFTPDVMEIGIYLHVYLTQVCMPHILHRRTHPCVSFWSAQVSQVTASGADMDALSEELFRQLSSGENVDLKAVVAHHRPPLPAARGPAPGHRPAPPTGASLAEAAAAAAQKRTGQMADAVSLLENCQVGPRQRNATELMQGK
jgi:hypothetical protein